MAERTYMYHLGPVTRCHRCGTQRLVRLKERDHIDPMYHHPLSLLQRLFSGSRLFHCRFCRIQFWDRRPAADEVAAAVPGGEQVNASS